jgi:hypothetical protein
LGVDRRIEQAFVLKRLIFCFLLLLFPALSALAADYVWAGAGVQTPEKGNGAPTIGLGGQWRIWYLGVEFAAYKNRPDNFTTTALSAGVTPLNFATNAVGSRGIVLSLGVAFTLLTAAAKTTNYGGYIYYDPYYTPEIKDEFHVLGEALVRVPFLKIGRGRAGTPDRLFVQGRVFGTPFESDLPRAFTGFSVTLGWQGRAGW